MCESCRLQLGAEKFGQVHSLPIDELLMTHPCILHILLPHLCSAFYIWNFFFVVISTLFVVFVIGLPSSTNDPLLVHFPPKLFQGLLRTCQHFLEQLRMRKWILSIFRQESFKRSYEDAHICHVSRTCIQMRRERWRRVRRFMSAALS